MKLTNISKEDLIYDSLQQTEENAENIIPAGYIPITLSTQGKLGAPKLFHIRNFKVREILSLAVTEEPDLPLRLIGILNGMILEEEIDVGEWHEKEIEELMVYLFYSFYKNTLTDVAFPIQESDIEFLSQQPDGEERIKELQEGKWVPRVDVVITRDVSTYDIPENFKAINTITNKKTGFFLTFNYPKYKDQIIIKRWVENFFSDEEFKYRRIQEQLKYNEKIEKQLDNNPNLASSLIKINPDEEYSYKEYLNARLQITSELLKIISIVNYNGQDVSKLSLSDKYKLMASDAQIDYGIISKLEKKQSKINFGIKPAVKMLNPITGQPCTRRFSFRISDILQALQLFGDDEYDDGDDD